MKWLGLMGTICAVFDSFFIEHQHETNGRLSMKFIAGLKSDQSTWL